MKDIIKYENRKIKDVLVPLIELPKDMILKAPSGFDYYVYNPLTDQYKKEVTGKNDIAHNKHAYSELKYYIINDEVLVDYDI